MYSAVLMLALTAGSETADFGRRNCCGCTGGTAVVVSHGCSGAVVGGCTGSASHGCHGGGLFARLRERHGCHGCTGSCGGVVVSTGCSGGVVAPVETKKAMPKGETVAPPVDKKKAQSVAPATILVSLPAGARLTIDGTATTSTAAQRTLVTPGLEVGMTYVYTMRAEFVRDGATVTQTQQVNVRGGETSVVQFNFSTQSVASR